MQVLSSVGLLKVSIGHFSRRSAHARPRREKAVCVFVVIPKKDAPLCAYDLVFSDFYDLEQGLRGRQEL